MDVWEVILSAYVILVLIGLGSVCGFVVWMVRVGKQIQKSEDLANKVVSLEVAAKKKNEYIKSVDEISNKAAKYEKELRSAYAAGDANRVQSLIRDLYSTSSKTKDAR